jgi:hypothetical protein
MLSVVRLNVVRTSVVAPLQRFLSVTTQPQLDPELERAQNLTPKL